MIGGKPLEFKEFFTPAICTLASDDGLNDGTNSLMIGVRELLLSQTNSEDAANLANLGAKAIRR